MLFFFTNLSLMDLFGLIISFLSNRGLFLVLDGTFSQLMLELSKAPSLVPHFSCYTLMTFLMMLSVILLSMLMLLLSTLSVIMHLICDNNSHWSVNLNLIYETLWTGAGRGFLISILEKFSWFCLTGLITLVLLTSKWMALLSRKNHLLRCWSWLSFLNWIGALTFSLLLRLPLRKLESRFILCMKFLSSVVAQYLYKFIIQPCMEYCCHVWAGAPGCYLELLDKLQKRICRTVGPSLAVSLQPFAHRRNVASLSFFLGITLVDVHLNWLNWFHFLILEGGLLIILIDCMIFLSPFLDVTRMFMSTVSFLAQLNSGILCL